MPGSFSVVGHARLPDSHEGTGPTVAPKQGGALFDRPKVVQTSKNYKPYTTICQ